MFRYNYAQYPDCKGQQIDPQSYTFQNIKRRRLSDNSLQQAQEYLHENQLVSVVACHTNAIESLKEIDIKTDADYRAIATCYKRQSGLHLELEDHAAVLESRDEAIRYLLKIGAKTDEDHLLLALGYREQGDEYLKKGSKPEALEEYDLAIKHFNSTKLNSDADWNALLHCYLRQGSLCTKMSKLKEAENAYKNALSVMLGKSGKEKPALAYDLVARIYQGLAKLYAVNTFEHQLFLKAYAIFSQPAAEPSEESSALLNKSLEIISDSYLAEISQQNETSDLLFQLLKMIDLECDKTDFPATAFKTHLQDEKNRNQFKDKIELLKKGKLATIKIGKANGMHTFLVSSAIGSKHLQMLDVVGRDFASAPAGAVTSNNQKVNKP